MGFSSLSGHARVNPNNPQAFGRCDRCSFIYNLVDLLWQYEYRGPQLMNTQLRVCRKCLDVPNLLNKPLRLPADPVPVYQPRTEQYLVDENGPTITNWDEEGVCWDQPDNEVWP